MRAWHAGPTPGKALSRTPWLRQFMVLVLWSAAMACQQLAQSSRYYGRFASSTGFPLHCNAADCSDTPGPASVHVVRCPSTSALQLIVMLAGEVQLVIAAGSVVPTTAVSLPDHVAVVDLLSMCAP